MTGEPFQRLIGRVPDSSWFSLKGAVVAVLEENRKNHQLQSDKRTFNAHRDSQLALTWVLPAPGSYFVLQLDLKLLTFLRFCSIKFLSSWHEFSRSLKTELATPL